MNDATFRRALKTTAKIALSLTVFACGGTVDVADQSSASTDDPPEPERPVYDEEEEEPPVQVYRPEEERRPSRARPLRSVKRWPSSTPSSSIAAWPFSSRPGPVRGPKPGKSGRPR